MFVLPKIQKKNRYKMDIKENYKENGISKLVENDIHSISMDEKFAKFSYHKAPYSGAPDTQRPKRGWPITTL